MDVGCWLNHVIRCVLLSFFPPLLYIILFMSLTSSNPIVSILKNEEKKITLLSLQIYGPTMSFDHNIFNHPNARSTWFLWFLFI